MKTIVISLLLIVFTFSCTKEAPKTETIEKSEVKAKKEVLPELKNKEKRFIIKQDGKFGFIDGNGKVIIEPKYDSALDFTEMLARVEKNGKFGFINKSGNVIVNFYLDMAWYFSNGFAVAYIDSREHGALYINKYGKALFENKYDINFSFNDGKAFVEDCSLTINSNGEEYKSNGLIRFIKPMNNLYFHSSTPSKSYHAFVLGKGLTSIEAEGTPAFYSDYSGQHISPLKVIEKDVEFVPSCEGITIEEKNNNITFKKDKNTVEVLKNHKIIDTLVCDIEAENIIWTKDLNKEKGLELYNLSGIKIAEFKNADDIRKIEYMDNNVIEISFYNKKESPVMFNITNGKIISDKKYKKEKFMLQGEICDIICELEKRGNLISSMEGRTTRDFCYNLQLKRKEKRVNDKRLIELYNKKNGKLLYSGDSKHFFKAKTAENICFIVGLDENKRYYFDEFGKQFWMGNK